MASKEERRRRSLVGHLLRPDTDHMKSDLQEGKRELDELKGLQARYKNNPKSTISTASSQSNIPSDIPSDIPNCIPSENGISDDIPTDISSGMSESIKPGMSDHIPSNIPSKSHLYIAPSTSNRSPKSSATDKRPFKLNGATQRALVFLFAQNPNRDLTYRQLEQMSNQRQGHANRNIRKMVENNLLIESINAAGYKTFRATTELISIAQAIFGQDLSQHQNEINIPSNIPGGIPNSIPTHIPTKITTDIPSPGDDDVFLEDRLERNGKDSHLSKALEPDPNLDPVYLQLKYYWDSPDGVDDYTQDYPYLSEVLAPVQLKDVIDSLHRQKKQTTYFIDSLKRIDFELEQYKVHGITILDKQGNKIDNLDNWYYGSLSRYGKYRIPNGYQEHLERLEEEEIKLAKSLAEKRAAAEEDLRSEWIERLDRTDIEKIKGSEPGFKEISEERALHVFWKKHRNVLIRFIREDAVFGLPEDLC